MKSSRTLIVASCGGALVVVVIALALRLRSVDTPSADKASKNVADKPLERARTICADGRPRTLPRCPPATQCPSASVRRQPEFARGRRPPQPPGAAARPGQGRAGGTGQQDLHPARRPSPSTCAFCCHAARSLEVRSRTGQRPTVREEAGAAFAWVVRQVQLQALSPLSPPPWARRWRRSSSCAAASARRWPVP